MTGKLGRRDILHIAALVAAAGCVRPSQRVGPKSADGRTSAMKTRPLMTLRLTTDPLQQLGATPMAERVTFPVVGGEFTGERLRGRVLPGGADWTIRRGDGILELDL